VRTTRFLSVFFMFTVAPATTAPPASFTMPTIVPVISCVAAGTENEESASSITALMTFLIVADIKVASYAHKSRAYRPRIWNRTARELFSIVELILAHEFSVRWFQIKRAGADL